MQKFQLQTPSISFQHFFISFENMTSNNLYELKAAVDRYLICDHILY